jgi:hypothetical protein
MRDRPGRDDRTIPARKTLAIGQLITSAGSEEFAISESVYALLRIDGIWSAWRNGLPPRKRAPMGLFFCCWPGEKDGRCAPGQAAMPLRPSNRGSRLQLPEPAIKKGPGGALFYCWLGERDSNPRWRSQSPQSYH